MRVEGWRGGRGKLRGSCIRGARRSMPKITHNTRLIGCLPPATFTPRGGVIVLYVAAIGLRAARGWWCLGGGASAAELKEAASHYERAAALSNSPAVKAERAEFAAWCRRQAREVLETSSRFCPWFASPTSSAVTRNGSPRRARLGTACDTRAGARPSLRPLPKSTRSRRCEVARCGGDG